MIEAIVKYIEDKGFTVYVFPHVIMIRKVWHGERVGADWCITQLELNYAYKEVLLYQADRYMLMIDKAIEKREEDLLA